MNKKILLILLLVFIPMNCFADEKGGGTAEFGVNWIEPTESPLLIDLDAGTTQTNIFPAITCLSDKGCYNVDIIIEYCKYSNDLDCQTASWGTGLSIISGGTHQPFPPMNSGLTVSPEWVIGLPLGGYGKKYKIKILISSLSTPVPQLYGERTIEMKTIYITSLGGDTSMPYADVTKDLATNLVLNIKSADATECRYKEGSPFTKVFGNLDGTSCLSILDPRIAICKLGGSNDLPNGTYNYYFACKNTNGIWQYPANTFSSAYNNQLKINFTVILPVLINVQVANLAGDLLPRYKDLVNDHKTDLVLKISTYNGEECMASPDSGFNSGNITCPVITGPGGQTSTCELGDLIEGSYTYYYKCKESGTENWSDPGQIDFDVDLTSMLYASIILPVQSSHVIGSDIEFESTTVNNNYTIVREWTSSVDTEWSKEEESFIYDGLSKGTHTIYLDVKFFEGDTLVAEKTAQVNNVRIISAPQNAFGITSFEVLPEKITTEDEIRVNATIKDYGAGVTGSQITLTVIDAESGKEMSSVSPVTKSFTIVSGEATVEFIIPAETLPQANYKIILDIPESPGEQNTSDNHASKIISVLKKPEEISASELSVLIIPALLFVILVILNKEKIRKIIKKKKQTEKNKKK